MIAELSVIVDLVKAVVDVAAGADEVIDDVVVANTAGIADGDGNVFGEGVLSAIGSTAVAVLCQLLAKAFAWWRGYERSKSWIYMTTGLRLLLLNDHAYDIKYP